MTTYFITRHAGALAWVKHCQLHFDVHLEHLTDPSLLQMGDIVIGTLPIQLVYELNTLGVRYICLSLQIPIELRGVELSIEQLKECKASLEEFQVLKPNPYTQLE